MFIKTLIDNVDRLVHNEVVYKVVQGIAKVPEEVAAELTKFAHWTEEIGKAVSEEIQAELEKGLTEEIPPEEPPVINTEENKVTEEDISPANAPPSDPPIEEGGQDTTTNTEGTAKKKGK